MGGWQGPYIGLQLQVQAELVERFCAFGVAARRRRRHHVHHEAPDAVTLCPVHYQSETPTAMLDPAASDLDHRGQPCIRLPSDAAAAVMAGMRRASAHVVDVRARLDKVGLQGCRLGELVQRP